MTLLQDSEQFFPVGSGAPVTKFLMSKEPENLPSDNSPFSALAVDLCTLKSVWPDEKSLQC